MKKLYSLRRCRMKSKQPSVIFISLTLSSLKDVYSNWLTSWKTALNLANQQAILSIRLNGNYILNAEEVKESESYLIETFQKLAELEKKGINGIWARIIKNAFAPLFVGQFDLIVGNPPWVNWESLPEDYRNALLPINHNEYKL